MIQTSNTFASERYLLGTTPDGAEWVTRYTKEDMQEVFTQTELTELDETGMTSTISGRDELLIVWIDMIASARRTFMEG